jgi:hypothetical protein
MSEFWRHKVFKKAHEKNNKISAQKTTISIIGIV